MANPSRFYAVVNCSGFVDPDAPLQEPKCPFYDEDDAYCSLMERYDNTEGLELPDDCLLRRYDISVYLAEEEKENV